MNYHNQMMSVTPVVWARVPLPVMRELRTRGFHDGYRLNGVTEIDILVEEAFGANHSRDRRIELLRAWVAHVDIEALLMKNGFATLYHPEAFSDVLRDAFGKRLVEVEASSLEEFFRKIEGSPLWRWNLTVFYHVACMGHWRDVIEEQFTLLARVGLGNVRLSVLGTENEAEHVLRTACRHGVLARLIFLNENLGLFELPTMQLLEKCARENDGALLYLHTKGVSAPHDREKQLWRRIMQESVVERWRENVLDLNRHDIVGCNWQDAWDKHYAGNFWITDSDYIRKLPTLADYYREPHGYPGGQLRCAAEFWIGCGNDGKRVKSLVTRNANFWQSSWLTDYYRDSKT